MSMLKVAGVRLRGSGKIYFFDPGELPMKDGSLVIVETSRGIEYGVTAGTVRELDETKVVQPLKTVIRLATSEDEERIRSNHEKEREAMVVCKEKIRAHGLEMKLIDAEYAFDDSKILFYFTADGRIDFRELVRDLASVFRTRIELRQIGVRDETKILGGIGICGRPPCCHTWLTEFVPVSIKMAKEQSLSLNPAKISGICGRLMCCLKNEEATYEYLKSKMPRIGDTVETPGGAVGEVSSVNVLRERVKVLIEEDDEKEVVEYDLADLRLIGRRSKGRRSREEKEEPEEYAENEANRQGRKERASQSQEDRQEAGENTAQEREDRPERKQRKKRSEENDWNTGKHSERESGKNAEKNTDRNAGSNNGNADRNSDRSSRRNSERNQEKNSEKKRDKGRQAYQPDGEGDDKERRGYRPRQKKRAGGQSGQEGTEAHSE